MDKRVKTGNVPEKQCCVGDWGALDRKVHCFLGAFAKLRRTTISFVMSVCPSFRLQQLITRWTDLHETCYMNLISGFHRALL
jgi:hypothetical protein